MRNYNLDHLNKLKDINKDSDIKKLSYLQSPGSHCPLFGAVMTACNVEDLALVVVGTQECTYYSKNLTYSKMQSDNKVFSLVVNKNDVTFGSQKKLEEALLTIDREYKPQGIVIVTTCVLEMIGEDFEGMARTLQDLVHAKLMVVRTDDFKCSSPTSGVVKTLDVLTELMEKQETLENTVNILGGMNRGGQGQELYQILEEKGLSINVKLPMNCTFEMLNEVSKAELNIVTEASAMTLAKSIKAKFGIDYIDFTNNLDIKRTKEAYEILNRTFNLKLDKEIETLYRKTLDKISEGKAKSGGKSFIWADSKISPFEGSNLLCQLGMEPLLIQTTELQENEHKYIKDIKAYGYNPYVTKTSSQVPLLDACDILHPDYIVGRINGAELEDRNMELLNFGVFGTGFGFESIMNAVDMVTSEEDDSMNMMMKMKGYGGNMNKDMMKKLRENPEFMKMKGGNKMNKGRKGKMKNNGGQMDQEMMERMKNNPEMMKMFEDNPEMMEKMMEMKRSGNMTPEMMEKMKGRK